MTNIYDHQGDYLMPYPAFADRVYRDGTWLGDMVVWSLHGSHPVPNEPHLHQIFAVDIHAVVVPLGLQLWRQEDERLFRLWERNHDPRIPALLCFDPCDTAAQERAPDATPSESDR